MIGIPLPAPQTPSVPAFTVNATLDNVTYTLYFQWNDRDSAWYLRILDQPGQTVLMADTRVPGDWPLYRNLIDRSPPGLLIVYDSTGQGTDPDLTNLGSTHQLYYVTAAELGL